MNTVVEIVEAVPRLAEFRFKDPINWSLNGGEHWAIIGPNGGGKTIFSDILLGKISLKDGEISYHFSDNKPLYEQIKRATFQDIYSLAGLKDMYYQQRWNATEEKSPLVLLSSGELRKFLISHILSSKPNVLILDNPYIGLDAPSREVLNELLEKIARQQDTQIILLLSNPADIPPVITHVLPIKDKKLLPTSSKSAFLNNCHCGLDPQSLSNCSLPIGGLRVKPAMTSSLSTPAEYTNALKMENIHIQYGERTILDQLNWTVKKGERWALLGPNGSGKSTLLSLVCADNPQGYANTFYLFDKKRGSGESIWEIKKRIGYVSPEVHLYFQSNQTCRQIVGSGFFDSIGLFRKCNEQQLETALEWMNVFGIEHLADRHFMQLSFGEQRLVILARAFVKNPELLILDEPLHGLDINNKQKVTAIIENFCRQPDKTLIYVTHYLHEIPPCVTKQFSLQKIS